MDLEDAMALAAEIAEPDFIERYRAMKIRLAELEAEQRRSVAYTRMNKETPHGDH